MEYRSCDSLPSRSFLPLKRREWRSVFRGTACKEAVYAYATPLWVVSSISSLVTLPAAENILENLWVNERPLISVYLVCEGGSVLIRKKESS